MLTGRSTPERSQRKTRSRSPSGDTGCFQSPSQSSVEDLDDVEGKTDDKTESSTPDRRQSTSDRRSRKLVDHPDGMEQVTSSRMQVLRIYTYCYTFIY